MTQHSIAQPDTTRRTHRPRHLRAAGSLGLIFAIMLLSACGFTLRGSEQARLPFDILHLQTPQGNSPLDRALEQALRGSGVEVLRDGEAALQRFHGYTLLVSDERLEQRAATVNSRARASQYEVLLSVDASILYQGEVLAQETVVVEMVHYEDVANITGSNNELELMRTEMRYDLVNQMLRRMQALAPPPPDPGR